MEVLRKGEGQGKIHTGARLPTAHCPLLLLHLTLDDKTCARSALDRPSPRAVSLFSPFYLSAPSSSNHQPLDSRRLTLSQRQGTYFLSTLNSDYLPTLLFSSSVSPIPHLHHSRRSLTRELQEKLPSLLSQLCSASILMQLLSYYLISASYLSLSKKPPCRPPYTRHSSHLLTGQPVYPPTLPRGIAVG